MKNPIGVHRPPQRLRRGHPTALGLGLVACSWLLYGCQPADPPAPAPVVAKPVVSTPSPTTPAPAQQPFQLALDGAINRGGTAQFNLQLKGGEGPVNAVLRFKLPEEAKLLAAYTPDGVVQIEQDIAYVIAPKAGVTVTFDVQGLKAGTSVDVEMLEAAANGSQTLSLPLTAQAIPKPIEGSFQPLPLTTPEGQFANLQVLTAQASNPPINVPLTIKRQWLKYELGDVNQDGKLDINDTLLLTQVLLKINGKVLDDGQRFGADLRDDQVVDFRDLALLVAKRLGTTFGLKVSLAAVHPKTLLLSNTPELLVVRNAGSGPNTLKVMPSAPWIQLRPLTQDVHNRTLAYEVELGASPPENATGTIKVEGGIEARSVNVGTLPPINTTPASETYPIQPGQTVVGLDGVSVTAPASWSEGQNAGATITIERLDPRTLAYPLDPRLRLGLPVYRVKASQPIFTDNREPFKVAIPVGRANPALLFPQRLSYLIVERDQGDTELTTWVDDSAAQVNAQNVVFETNGFIDDTHLFTAALLDEPRVVQSSLKAQSFEGDIVAVCPAVTARDAAGKLVSVTVPCTANARSLAVTWTKTHVSDFKSIFGFTDADFDAVLTREVYLIPSAIAAVSFPDACTSGGVRGYYSPTERKFVVCTTANVGDLTNPDYTYTVRHELMHAVQYRIKKWTNGSTGKNWILEGTARASEGSSASAMSLSPRFEDTLRIDQPFNTAGGGGQRTYAHQDFWVYLGKKAGQGLPYLRPIFEQGIPSPTAGVSAAIAGNSALSGAGLGSLGKAYWGFAKNQAIEHNPAVRSGDAACQLDTAVLTSTPATLAFPTLKANAVTGNLQPLQSAGYTFSLSGVRNDGDKTMYALSSKVVNNADDIKIAVYIKKGGRYTCPPQELTLGTLQELKVNNTTELFVLVSNISYSTSRAFKFELGKGKLESLTPPTVSAELELQKEKVEEFSFKNAGLAALDYEIKWTPQGGAAQFATVKVNTPALIGTVAAAALKADETADPKQQDGELAITCIKQTTSAIQWKAEFFDRAVEGTTPQAELMVSVICKDLRPPIVQQTGSGEEVTQSGDECQTTTTYRPWATYSVTLPGDLDPAVRITSLSDNQGKSTSSSPWVLNGKLYSGQHGVTGTLRTEAASATSESLAISVPPVRTETQEHDCGGNAGDPHLSSLDGQRFSFQGVGEYVFTRTADRSFEVQMRFHQMGEQGSANSAIAMNVAGDRVGFYALGNSGSSSSIAVMKVNGREIPVSLTSIQSLDLAKGGRVEIVPGKVKIIWPDSNFVSLRWRGEFFDFVTVGVLPQYRNRLQGLLGNDSRDRSDDYRGRDGTQYPNPPSFEQLYKGFGDSWRIRQDESLFDYALGQSTATFTKLDFPPAPIPFTADQTSQAEARCRAAGVISAEALQNCVFDVANTQTSSPATADQLAQAAVNYDPAHPSASLSPAWSEVLPSAQITLGAVITGNAAASEVTWQASGGVITPRGDGTATFTAPATAGRVTITGTLRGQTTQALVEVRSGLIEAPQELQVFEGNTQTVSVRLVGTPPDISLSWSVARGQVTGTGTQVQYLAPASSGDDTVTVEVMGKPDTRVSIPVKVLVPTIRLSPQTITLYSGDAVGLNALVAGFNTSQAITWTTTGGTLNPGLGAAVFTAPNIPGQYTVTASVTSRPGIQATATITVLRVDPIAQLSGIATVHAGEQTTIRALNADGTPYTASPVTWQAMGGQLNIINSSTATFTAGINTGNYSVTATPVRLPNTPTVLPLSVFIEKPVIRFVNGVAASAIVPVNEQVTVIATRSTGAPYPLELDWSATGGTITASAGTASYTAGSTVGEFQISATPRLAAQYRTDLPVRVVQRITGETRFILTWGASPADLDTHLWLPASTPYHVYYGRTGQDAVCPFAQLDQDDTNGFGPEIMRVKGLTGSQGVYSLQIFNYSQSGTFTQSEAKIQVVSTATGETLTTVDVPAGNAPGLWWNVLTFDAATGVITVINTVGDLNEPYVDTQSGCNITTQSTARQTMNSLSIEKPRWQPGVAFPK